jgi:predicted amidophosphoribosyltransferase
VFTEILGAVLPLACPGCGRASNPICPGCRQLLRPAPVAPAPVGVERWDAAFSYEGVARELVARVKYRRLHAATGWLADAMVPLVGPPLPQVVTWAPTTTARRRARGFDHAELLARAVARRLHRPARSLLRRGDGPAQTDLSASARRRGPAFTVRGVVAGSVLIVDDVATTGATVSAAAVALRDRGAGRVTALTAARTPAPEHR